MEEFIENFNEFRTWLYDKVENSEENNDIFREVIENLKNLVCKMHSNKLIKKR